MKAPKAGDIAFFEDCVEGGDPYRVVVCYRFFQEYMLDPPYAGGRWRWYNTAGIGKPLADSHPGLSHLTLLVRDGHSEHGYVAQFAPAPKVDNQDWAPIRERSFRDAGEVRRWVQGLDY